MTNLEARKKPVPLEDWHPADVIAELRKAEWSLRQLGVANGVGRSTLPRALHYPYPKAEAIIAKALGLKPQQIWPSRYNKDGTTNRRRGPAPRRPANHTAKATTAPVSRNTQRTVRP